jgi:hypothetical protein
MIPAHLWRQSSVSIERQAKRDLPRLKVLLDDEDFFVKEAAAWPLSDLVGADVLPDLFRAFQRGLTNSTNNDGFSTALIDLPVTDPEGVRQRLLELMASGDSAMARECTGSWSFQRRRLTQHARQAPRVFPDAL